MSCVMRPTRVQFRACGRVPKIVLGKLLVVVVNPIMLGMADMMTGHTGALTRQQTLENMAAMRAACIDAIVDPICDAAYLFTAEKSAGRLASLKRNRMLRLAEPGPDQSAAALEAYIASFEKPQNKPQSFIYVDSDDH